MSSTKMHMDMGSSSGSAAVRSPWHSPVPYLLGGLAAMLGLIAFALLILACSYWRVSTEDNEDDDLEKGEGGIDKMKSPGVYEEKIVVIMAGHHNPTFLANPVKIGSHSKHETIIINTDVVVTPPHDTVNHNDNDNDENEEKPKEDENNVEHDNIN